MNRMEYVDVVVAGAGPVGLLTAIELTLAGVDVMVLERLGSASTAMKAMGFGPLAGEALRRRGMAAAIAAEEARSTAAMQAFAAQTGADLQARAAKFSGHFAGLLIRREASQNTQQEAQQNTQQQPARSAVAVSQQGLEAMLAERARALGIDVRRGCEVTSLVQREDGVGVGVDVGWRGAAGPQAIGCAYLIGCDGGRSTVRKLAGFDFPGTAPTSTFYQAVATIDHPERLLPVGWHRQATGVFSYGPAVGTPAGRLFMLDFQEVPGDRDAPVTRDEVEMVLRRVSGQDIRVLALDSASRWSDHTRLVDNYRQGRVLLAGDAAHIHSPFGGQGLSLGLVDAANLGWKLAAVIQGRMPASLLDSYSAERRPVAQAVLANTLAQVALLRPDPQSGALRDLVASMLQTGDGNRLVSELVSGLGVRYDLESNRGSNQEPEPEPDMVGRLIGDRLINNGDGGATLYQAMQDGTGVLLDASAGASASRLAMATSNRIRCITVATGPSMLIRPDACVAWSNDGDGIDALAQALERWFGPVR